MRLLARKICVTCAQICVKLAYKNMHVCTKICIEICNYALKYANTILFGSIFFEHVIADHASPSKLGGFHAQLLGVAREFAESEVACGN